jgi:hypothetical protein
MPLPLCTASMSKHLKLTFPEPQRARAYHGCQALALGLEIDCLVCVRVSVRRVTSVRFPLAARQVFGTKSAHRYQVFGARS